MGLPLRAAADLLASARSRGRHGNALQWHLGLEMHDGVANLDWENRIEVKLVSVWRGAEGRVLCDKLKVCDIAVDPWAKLANVLFVFADRLTRVVVGAAFFHLAPAARTRLGACWSDDPHFGDPDLFVEAREQAGRSAPAYYLAGRWLEREGLLPPKALPWLLSFDRRWWTEVRASTGRDPLPSLTHVGRGSALQCPRCDGTLHFDDARLQVEGWAPARHAMPLGDICAVRGHFVVDGARVPQSRFWTTDEFACAFEGRCQRATLWRLADRVPEPEDHLHAFEPET